MTHIGEMAAAAFGLMSLPFSIYGSWLLYHHVNATDLMWFIWWIAIPLTIVTQVLHNVFKDK